MKANYGLVIHNLSEIQNLKVHGRSSGEMNPLTLFWTGSGIELNAKGSELWVEVEADYDVYEPWISILINDEPISRQMITVGRQWICVFRGMNENTIKNVRIIREVQAMSGDPSCMLQIHAVKFDGAFVPVEDKPYRIEFIGDSITSGEGALGARQEEDWISMWFSAVYNYTAMTAGALNADYRVMSQSGWGILTSWDNNPNCNIPQYYDKVCGILSGNKNLSLGAQRDNDFEVWKPDIVVINLGTNDGGAFYSPAWTDEATGQIHKQRLKEDGTLEEEDIKAFEVAAINFLNKLRSFNKEAQIVWAYGMLGNLMMAAIQHAVDTYKHTSKDERVSVIALPNTTEVTVGARQHPGRLAHKETAEVLSNYLKKFLL